MNVEKKYISFLIRQILDDKDIHRGFRTSNFQSEFSREFHHSARRCRSAYPVVGIKFNLISRTSRGKRTGQIRS